MSNLKTLTSREGFRKNPQNINRKGRPKSFKGLTATLRDVMESDGSMIIENIIELNESKKETGNIIKYGKVKIPKGEMIILAAAKKAMKGDMRAIEYITDRLEGKATQKIEQTNKVTVLELPNNLDLSKPPDPKDFYNETEIND